MEKILGGILPDSVTAKIGAVIGAFGWLLQEMLGYNQALPTLLSAMALDYVTGILAAAIYKKKHPKSRKGLDSRVGALGILKKVAILCVVVLAHLIDESISIDGVEPLVTWFYIGNEGLSIIENAVKCGIPVPQKIIDLLEQISDDDEEKPQP